MTYGVFLLRSNGPALTSGRNKKSHRGPQCVAALCVVGSVSVIIRGRRENCNIDFYDFHVKQR